MVLNQGNQNLGANNTQKNVGGKVSNYTFELDRMKVFWIFILTLLVLTFVFIFGYWTGQQTSSEYSTFAKEVGTPKELSSENSEIRELLGESSKDSHKTTVNIEKENLGNTDLKEGLAANTKKTEIETEDQEETVKKSSPTKKSSKTKKVAVDNKRKYIIQFASFKEKNKAVNLRNKIKDSGMKAYITKEGNVYKVRIGNFEDYDKAAHTLSKAMKDFKVKDAYIFTTGKNKKA